MQRRLCLLLSLIEQDSSEKLETKAYIWANKDDPDLYGTWDFEVSYVLTCSWIKHYMYNSFSVC